MKNDFLPKVSIVIPVYNAGNYLDNCMQSVINQTYKDIEIIAVNDGSTDNSLEILRQYAAVDNRFTIIDKQNGGPSLARKKGLKIASGKYVQFLDSDDELVLDAIESLVSRAEAVDADIVAFSFLFVEADWQMQSTEFSFHVMRGEDYLREILCSRAHWSLWANFQKRILFKEILDDGKSGMLLGEDFIWTVQLSLRAKKVVSLNRALLRYNQHSTSLSHKKSFNDARYREFMFYTDWIDLFLLRIGLSDNYKKELAFFHLKNTLLMLHWKKIMDVHKRMRRVVKDLKEYNDLQDVMTKRELKIVAVYRFSSWFGYLNLLRYYKQGKL